MNARTRVAGTIGALALITAGFGAVAGPAHAATDPAVTLRRGTVTITGTDARDLIAITSDATQLVVDLGFDGMVDAQFPRSRYERAQVLAGGGDDAVSLTGTGDVPITLSGGDGGDGLSVVGSFVETGEGDASTTISGDDGNDGIFAAVPGPVTLLGGAGDDDIDDGGAGVGQETVSLGDGNDRFRSLLNSSFGARTDSVDGGIGQDTMQFEGSFASESLSLSASAGHLIVDHDLRDRIDADNVEDVTYFGFGGADEGGGDAVAVNDLSGTDVVRFTPNFSANLDSTAPNNSGDTLTVRGTAGVDNITVSGSGANITVTGLTPTVTPVFLQPEDVLRIETLDGNDFVESSGRVRRLVQLLVL